MSTPKTVRGDAAATDQQLALITTQLNDNKAGDLQVIDIDGRSSVADYIVIASGNSTRHVRSMADYLVTRLKQQGTPPLGVEGANEGEWVLVDAGDVIVHLMLPRVREFYNLESLWDEPRERQGYTNDKPELDQE